LLLTAVGLWGAIAAQGAVETVVIDAAEIVSNVRVKPGGFVTCWLLDSDEERPRSPSMVEEYRAVEASSLRFPYGQLSNNYLWTTPPYSKAVDGLSPRPAAPSRAPASLTVVQLIRE
jgi:hypothetical protein